MDENTVSSSVCRDGDVMVVVLIHTPYAKAAQGPLYTSRTTKQDHKASNRGTLCGLGGLGGIHCKVGSDSFSRALRPVGARLERNPMWRGSRRT